MELRCFLLLLDLCVIRVLQCQAQGLFCGFEKDFCPDDLRIVTKVLDGRATLLYKTSTATSSSRAGPTRPINGSFAFLEASGLYHHAGDHVSLDMTRLLFLDTACLSFNYHMADYGSREMGSLQVHVYDGWTTLVIARISGNQGTGWHSFQRTVHNFEKARWTLFRGSGSRGYIAIDDLRITTGSCSGSNGPAPQGQPIIGSGTPREFSCSFESGFCETDLVIKTSRGFQLDGICERSNSGTPSDGTGPTVPISGYYTYLEATDVFEGEYVQLEMRNGMDMKEACLSFNYHMTDGGDGQIGSLLIEINRFGKFEQRTIISGDHGNNWNLFQRNISDFWIARWTLTRGSGFKGDIAIDNLKVSPGWCSTTSGPSVLPLKEFSCDFENGYCSNELSITTNSSLSLNQIFKRSNLSTPTTGTGPNAPIRGYYAYLEASSTQPGEFVQLEMKNNLNLRAACLAFSYHMRASTRFPAEMGSLSVDIARYGVFSNLIKFNGDLGSHWKLYQRNVTNFDKVRWTLTAGSGYRSDIALDNLRVTPGKCPWRGELYVLTASQPTRVTFPPTISPSDYRNIWHDTCGSSPYSDAGNTLPGSSRIVGGDDARPHEFPWTGSLRRYPNPIYRRHLCGVVLIHPQFVLTSAHCLEPRHPTQIAVVLGEHKPNVASRVRRVYTVERFRIHPYYNAATKDSDIAIIKLSHEVSLNQNITPVCAPEPGTLYQNDISQAAGWGSVNPARPFPPDTLQWVSLPILSNSICSNAIRRFAVTLNMICAGGRNETHRDTCQGDFGGPLTTKRNGIFELVGLTSWENSCANGTPGVYTRVSKFVTWVASQIRTL